MSKTCFVCKVLHLEVISIFQHPEKLDSTLKYLMGLQAKQDDYLCKDCCDEVINTFKSKRKFNQSNAKSLRGDETLSKEEINFPGRIEAMILQVPKVKIEQNNEEPERSFYELTEGTETTKLIEQLKTGEGTKEKPETQRGFMDSYKNKRDTANQGQISDDESINYRDKFKVETLSDVENSNDEFDHNGGQGDINSSELKDETKENEVALKGTEGESVVHSNENSCTAQGPFTCCYCPKTFVNSSNLKEHVSIHMKEKSHFCSDCGKEFKFSDALKRHRRTHTGENLYACNYCPKTFILNGSFLRHLRTHTNQKLHECSECGKRFTSSTNFKSHSRIHTGEKPYTCLYCPKTFSFRSNFRIHLRRHKNERSHNCPDCGKSFFSSAALRYHRTVHTGERAYTCRYCSKTFATSPALSTHIRIHTNEKLFECSVCGKSFITSSRLKDHSRVHTEGTPYACSYCPKTFSSNSYLKTHLLRHTNKKSHICSDCGKGFICSKDLKQHKRVHTGERPYVCRECSKTFTTSAALSRHKRTHTKEKSFECSQCEESFVNLPSLKKHKRIHTGDILCLYCPKTFKKSSNHLLHVQTKHAKDVNAADSEKKLHQSNPLNPKPSKSDGTVCKNEIDVVDQTEIEISSSEFEVKIKSECKDESENILNTLELGNQPETIGNAEVWPEEQRSADVTIKTENGSALSSEMPISSPHISEVESHKRTHIGEKPYACNYCPKTFNFKGNFNIHVRRHMNERSHVCSDCGKGFICSQGLKRHKTVHTGERPYVCIECSKTFSTSAALSRHKRTHAKEKLFGCSQCEQSFVNLLSLKKHKRIHTGEIPCLYCTKSFKKSSNHLLHVQTKHAKEVNAVDSEKKLHHSNPPNSKLSKSDGTVCNNEIDVVDQTEIEISTSELEVKVKAECKDELKNMLKTSSSALENQLETIENVAQSSADVIIKTENGTVRSYERPTSSDISEVIIKAKNDIGMDSSQNHFDNIEGSQESFKGVKLVDIKLEAHNESKDVDTANS